MKQFKGEVTGGMRYTIVIEDDQFISSTEEEAKMIVQGSMNNLFCDLIAQGMVRELYIRLNKELAMAKQRVFDLFEGR